MGARARHKGTGGNLSLESVVPAAGNVAQGDHFTGEELQVKFLSDSRENSLKY